MAALVWLDLCSGLGGASQPAKDRGWRVIRVDIDPRFKPDIVADVRALPLRPFHVDVMWASPPCQEFSKIGLRCFYPEPIEPDLSIANGVKAVIDRFMPEMWVVENVWASRPYLSKIFGPVGAKPPGHALWSNKALLLPNVEPHKGGRRAFAHLRREVPAYLGNARPGYNRAFVPHLRHMPAEAARIPYEIGEAICRAVEQRSCNLTS